MQSPEEGAQTTLYCALSDELAAVSGNFFADCHPISASRTARDDQLAHRLWKLSEHITGLSK